MTRFPYAIAVSRRHDGTLRPRATTGLLAVVGAVAPLTLSPRASFTE